MDVIKVSAGDELDCYFDTYEKRRNGPSMGLNGIRSATVCSSASAISSTHWNGIETCTTENGDVHVRPEKLNSTQSKLQQQVQQHPSEAHRRPSSATRYRPVSTNSYSSLTSPDMSDIRWRNSRVSLCPAMPSSWQLIHESPNLWKHEGYLDEEKEILGRGVESAKKLITWYRERLKSVQKRASLLSRGLVSVDGAVHEQKLNYLRAHIAELNRRITSLVESSDRSFPTHSNLQVRTHMPQPNDDRSQYYLRQNMKLSQEVAHKDRVIEQLLRDKVETNNRSSAFRKVHSGRLRINSVAAKRNAHLHSLVPLEGTLM